MCNGTNKLARGSIPELGGFIRTRCKNSGIVGTKYRRVYRPLMVERGDEVAGGRIPKPGGLVPACRQDPSPVPTKSCGEDRVLVVQRRDERWQRLFTMND